jgi:uncharacterized phage infection (PIP) family protein YhgE
MDKFVGRAKSQKLAAMVEELGSELELSDDGLMKSEEKDSEVAAASDTLAQLVQQQKDLAEQIAALRDQGF